MLPPPLHHRALTELSQAITEHTRTSHTADHAPLRAPSQAPTEPSLTLTEPPQALT